MAKKKDFSAMNTNPIYDSLAEVTADPEEHNVQQEQENHKTRKERKTYTEEEQKKAMNEMRTSGRKGVKMPRINMAFSPEVYEYIQTMSRVRGETMTKFINHEMKKSMKENADIYAKAIEFRNSL